MDGMSFNSKEEVLQSCTVEGCVVKLPNVQLERKLYQEVAKALELIGGKWKGGKVFGFVFLKDPTELLRMIANGEKKNLKKEFQFFATPELLADDLVRMANLKDDDTILEPSAGQGAIIKAINKVSNVTPDCYELMDTNLIILKKSGLRFKLKGENFLENDGTQYRKIIANPPFSKDQDILHITEMYKCLDFGGKIVCVMSECWVNSTRKSHESFRKWLGFINAEVIDVEKGAFKQSGTMIGSKIVIITK